jgi:hypothetical protein
MGPAQLGPMSDCTANYRAFLSSERAPYIKEKTVIVKYKKIKI